MTVETFLRIKELLDKEGILYRHLTHDDVSTSSEFAAAVRGTDIQDAAKAIILKAVQREGDEYFIQAVLSGNRRIDLKILKQFLDLKNIALASPHEVLEKTGCTIGSVPPFGMLFGIRMFLDKTVLDREEIVFSAGTHTDSIVMNPEDYLRVTQPLVTTFSKPLQNQAKPRV
jgi:Ala-tRNA(Pro) deacylase